MLPRSAAFGTHLRGKFPGLTSKATDAFSLKISAWPSVLVSAGIELIVFLLAGTVLCFEFSMRRMLITLMFSVVAQ